MSYFHQGMSQREYQRREITWNISSIFSSRKFVENLIVVREKKESRTKWSYLDAVKYAHHLFTVIDRNHRGTFTFDVS